MPRRRFSFRRALFAVRGAAFVAGAGGTPAAAQERVEVRTPMGGELIFPNWPMPAIPGLAERDVGTALRIFRARPELRERLPDK